MSRNVKGMLATPQAAKQSGWCTRAISDGCNQNLFKNWTVENGRYFISREDVDDLRWLNDHNKKLLKNLKIIDELRAQETDAIEPKPKPTSKPRTTKPKEATAAVVKISSRRSQINERLWNIAAGFIIAGGIALGFIAFMAVIIGVAALM